MIHLRKNWRAIEEVARKRLKNNSKTKHHRKEFGNELEIMGAAGEIAARRFLKLPLWLQTTFDNGIDLEWRGHTVDVKATRWVPTIMSRYLQWPKTKNIKADLILMTAIDFEQKKAILLGFCSREELERAPVNEKRDIPCMEVPVTSLRKPEKLFDLNQRQNGSKVQRSSNGSGKKEMANALQR